MWRLCLVWPILKRVCQLECGNNVTVRVVHLVNADRILCLVPTDYIEDPIHLVGNKLRCSMHYRVPHQTHDTERFSSPYRTRGTDKIQIPFQYQYNRLHDSSASNSSYFSSCESAGMSCYNQNSWKERKRNGNQWKVIRNQLRKRARNNTEKSTIKIASHSVCFRFYSHPEGKLLVWSFDLERPNQYNHQKETFLHDNTFTNSHTKTQ